tara:strand:- start:1428 stop:2324 length:897 start_codon:yes stop_codon:yes gene_type:complete
MAKTTKLIISEGYQNFKKTSTGEAITSGKYQKFKNSSQKAVSLATSGDIVNREVASAVSNYKNHNKIDNMDTERERAHVKLIKSIDSDEENWEELAKLEEQLRGKTKKQRDIKKLDLSSHITDKKLKKRGLSIKKIGSDYYWKIGQHKIKLPEEYNSRDKLAPKGITRHKDYITAEQEAVLEYQKNYNEDLEAAAKRKEAEENKGTYSFKKLAEGENPYNAYSTKYGYWSRNKKEEIWGVPPRPTGKISVALTLDEHLDGKKRTEERIANNPDVKRGQEKGLSETQKELHERLQKPKK